VRRRSSRGDTTAFTTAIGRGCPPQPLDKAGPVLKVIQDIDDLANRCDEPITSECREFLAGVGSSAAIISQAGS
jgi:hypothetical protein